jgi:hypothetical protein
MEGGHQKTVVSYQRAAARDSSHWRLKLYGKNEFTPEEQSHGENLKNGLLEWPRAPRLPVIVEITEDTEERIAGL